MSSDQILWGVNTLLLAIIGVLIRGWMANVKDTFEKIDKRFANIDAEKISVKSCEMMHGELKKISHTHGVLGQAGEVIR
jgi:hypothetical protein